ncbi:MAG: hypothetical protein WAM14_02815 [Candidatus Nitrosopolaris sp.]
MVSGSRATTVYAHTKAYEAGVAVGGKGSNPFPPGSKDAIHYNVGVQDASKGSTVSTGSRLFTILLKGNSSVSLYNSKVD